jgi:hypothetical protein
MTLGISSLAVVSGVAAPYVPLSLVSDLAAGLPPARIASSGIPAEHLLVLSPSDLTDPSDVSASVLASVGLAEEPLFLVRSGPQRDTMVAALARLVHESGWLGEEVGITHLDELGGTVVFDLLSWAVSSSATVVICDEPLFADARGGASFSAVGLRVTHGRAPLRALASGEGSPPSFADHNFAGAGPCDAWISLHAALAAGDVTDGDSILLHAKGPNREGWLTLTAVDLASLHFRYSASP